MCTDWNRWHVCLIRLIGICPWIEVNSLETWVIFCQGWAAMLRCGPGGLSRKGSVLLTWFELNCPHSRKERETDVCISMSWCGKRKGRGWKRTQRKKKGFIRKWRSSRKKLIKIQRRVEGGQDCNLSLLISACYRVINRAFRWWCRQTPWKISTHGYTYLLYITPKLEHRGQSGSQRSFIWPMLPKITWKHFLFGMEVAAKQEA